MHCRSISFTESASARRSLHSLFPFALNLLTFLIELLIDNHFVSSIVFLRPNKRVLNRLVQVTISVAHSISRGKYFRVCSKLWARYEVFLQEVFSLDWRLLSHKLDYVLNIEQFAIFLGLQTPCLSQVNLPLLVLRIWVKQRTKTICALFPHFERWN